MRDNAGSSENKADSSEGEERGEVQHHDQKAAANLDELVEQVNRGKRTVDQMLLDTRPWAQISLNKQTQDRMSRILSSIYDQNSEMMLALTPSVTEKMKATLASLNDRIYADFDVTVLSNALAGQSEQAKRAITDALGTISETSRNLSTLESLRNRPGFATSTQRFLASTDELRYRRGKTVWHYTSGFVLMQVLSKHYFWASIPHNLNDSSEVTHGLEIIQDAFDRALHRLESEWNLDSPTRDGVSRAVEQVLDRNFFDEVINEIYIISASGDNDNLTLWRNYSGGDGFAIGISTSTTLSSEGITETAEAREAEAKDGVPPIAGWYKVHYSDTKKKELADEFVANAIQDIVKSAASNRSKLVKEQRKHILILASMMKHKAFKDEKEVRWMTTNWMPTEFMPRGSAVHYEHTPRGIVPVLHLHTSSSDKNALLPIKGIRCSPAAPDGIERTVKGLLAQRGYVAASRKVEQSVQPFKG